MNTMSKEKINALLFAMVDGIGDNNYDINYIGDPIELKDGTYNICHIL